jgi:hypothetical protein
MDGLRMVDEWQSIEKLVPSEDTVFEPRTSPSRGPGDAARVFALIDGRLSVRRVIDLAQLGTFDGMRVLSDLRSSGAIREVEVAGAQALVRRARAVGSAWLAVGGFVVALAPFAGADRGGLVGRAPAPRTPAGDRPIVYESLASLRDDYAVRAARHAIEAYRLSRGRWPDGLEDLASAGLPAFRDVGGPRGARVLFAESQPGTDLPRSRALLTPCARGASRPIARNPTEPQRVEHPSDPRLRRQRRGRRALRGRRPHPAHAGARVRHPRGRARQRGAAGGPTAEVGLARKVLEHLYGVLKSGRPVGAPEVRDAVRMVMQEPDVDLDEAIDDVLADVGSRRRIGAKTLAQRHYIDLMRKHDVVFAIGPAGTGKTYLAMAMAIAALNRHEVARVVLTRPAVEAGEKLGFLPGTMARR